MKGVSDIFISKDEFGRTENFTISISAKSLFLDVQNSHIVREQGLLAFESDTSMFNLLFEKRELSFLESNLLCDISDLLFTEINFTLEADNLLSQGVETFVCDVVIVEFKSRYSW
jgi:hypothetical protein